MGSKLLIVDDETSIADLMRDALEIEGFEAYAVYSGNQAIEFLAKREVDLVVSDVRMPDGDGLFLLRSISSMANPPKVV
ncbi:MAG: response regulator, partial [Bacteriovoracaceae bacterium]